MSDLPYNSYSAYLRRRYGRPAYRVAVDAGFSCPNRPDGRGGAGCSYCEIGGARAVYLDEIGPAELESQIGRGTAFLRKRYGAAEFLLYFQAYTGTAAPLERLRTLYDSALALENFRELIVSTRPDEVDAERADLLAGYIRDDFDVWVELGLQSVHDETLARINRGHDSAAFFSAYRLLTERGIKVAVHLILGLPGEGLAEIRESVRSVARLRPAGIKLHNLHVPVSAPLYAEYLAGELTVPSPARHAHYLAETIPLLPPETVVMRITCDTPRHRRGAPADVPMKSAFADEVVRLMRERGVRQGSAFVPPP